MPKAKQKDAKPSRAQGLRDRGSALTSKFGRRRPKQGPAQRTVNSVKRLVAGAASRLPGGGTKGKSSAGKNPAANRNRTVQRRGAAAKNRGRTTAKSGGRTTAKSGGRATAKSGGRTTAKSG